MIKTKEKKNGWKILKVSMEIGEMKKGGKGTKMMDGKIKSFCGSFKKFLIKEELTKNIVTKSSQLNQKFVELFFFLIQDLTYIGWNFWNNLKRVKKWLTKIESNNFTAEVLKIQIA